MATAITHPESPLDVTPNSAQPNSARPGPTWFQAIALADLKASGRALIKRDGKQIALFATPSGPRAIANRCPHEGYPLSEGTLNAGTGSANTETPCTLTCNWHNWKFDLETGTEASGGDAVRTFPLREIDGMLWVEVVDPTAEEKVRAAIDRLHAAFTRYDYERFTREIARIELAGGDPLDAVRAAIGWTHDRFEWGMTHALAAAPDWVALHAEADDPVDRIATVAEIVGHLCWDSVASPAFPFASGAAGAGAEPWDEDKFVDAVEHEDEAAATKLLRGGLQEGGWAAVDRGIARAALAHYQDFGHAVIYVEKTREAIERLGPSVAEPIGLACLRALINARREDLIPEFKAYRPMRDAWDGRGSASPKPADFCRASVAKTLERINAAGASIPALYDSLMEAAAWQLARFDPIYSLRTDQPISRNANRLDFSHAITFANAGRRIAERYPELWPDVLLQIGCFLGRNAGFVDPARDISEWQVEDPRGFLAETAANIVDHRNSEFIVSAHLVKMTCAVREEVEARPEAPWVPGLVTALNRFLNEPIVRKLTRRTAYQALKTVEGE